MGSTF
ncbi:UNVERIFIED_CONTAM: hypothetical protein GTU68_059901 [Idotea baltica]